MSRPSLIFHLNDLTWCAPGKMMTVRCQQIRMPFRIFSNFFIENSSAGSFSKNKFRLYT